MDQKSTLRSKTLSTDTINVVLFKPISNFQSDSTYNTKVKTQLQFKKVQKHSKKNRKKRKWLSKFSLQMKMMIKNSFGKKDLSNLVSKDPSLFIELFWDQLSVLPLF